MRRLGYAIAALVLLAVLIPGIRGLLVSFDPQHFLKGADAPWKLDYAAQAAVSLAYMVDEGGVEFPVPSGANRLKLVTHARFPDVATLRKQQLADPARRWTYAVEITLLGQDDTVVLQRVQHFRTNITEWQDAEGRTLTSVYLLTEHATPSNGAVLQLDLAGLSGDVERVRLRLAEIDSEADGVLARVYYPEPFSERQLGYLWERLHSRQRELLAKGSVFSHELLLEDEKRNLLRNRWQPAAPRGTRGLDFKIQELYVLRDLEGERVELPIPPAGVMLTPGRHAMIPVPETGGQFRIAFDVLDGTAPAADVEMKWYGRSAFERSTARIAPEGGRLQWRGELSGGLLEFISDGLYAVRIHALSSTGNETEITPDTLYERTFVATLQSPVVYELAHASGRATPIRLELRTLDGADMVRPAVAHYVFKDAAGKMVANGALDLMAPRSAYDVPHGALADLGVSDVDAFFFVVPEQAVQLSVFPQAMGAHGDAAALLVSLQSRPAGLARITRVPEDRFEYGVRGDSIPAWFGVRPLEYERRILDDMSRLLVVQPRPPEDREVVLAGDYQWEEYRPEGDWLGRMIFSPRDPVTPFRDEALVSTFTPLATGRLLRVKFPEFRHQEAVTPTLVWLNEARGNESVRIRVSIDGASVQEFRGRGHYGEAALNALAVGAHSLRIDAPRGVRVYLNHLVPGPDARVRRLANRLNGPLRFEYQRTTIEEEFLSARLFQARGGATGEQRARLRIRVAGAPVEPLQPRRDWVFGERVVDVRAADGDAAPVFSTAGERVDTGQPVFLPFPQGTPKGRYRIEIEVLDGVNQNGQLYLALSRIGAIPEARRRIHIEPVVRDADDKR